MPIIKRIDVVSSLTENEQEQSGLNELNELIDIINNYHLQYSHQHWLSQVKAADLEDENFIRKISRDEFDDLDDKEDKDTTKYYNRKLVLFLVRDEMKANQIAIDIVRSSKTDEHKSFLRQFVGRRFENEFYKKEFQELKEEFRTFTQFLSFSAEEIVVLSKLVEELALALMIVKDNNAKLGISDKVNPYLAKLGAEIQSIRAGLADYMFAFAGENEDYRELVAAKTVKRLRDNYDGLDIGGDTPFYKETIDFPSEDTSVKIKVCYSKPAYIDFNYYIKNFLIRVANGNVMEINDNKIFLALDCALWQDQSFNALLPSMFNKDAKKQMAVKQYFEEYVNQVNEKMQDPAIIQAMNDGLSLSAVLNRVDHFVEKVYEEMSERWENEFEALTKRVFFLGDVHHTPSLQEHAAPRAPRLKAIVPPIAQNHEIRVSSEPQRESEEVIHYLKVFQDEARVMMKQLEEEIENNKKFADSFFEIFNRVLRKKIQVKEEKRDALKKLIDARTFSGLKEIAKKMLEKENLTDGVFFLRTKDFLVKIVDFQVVSLRHSM